VLTAGAQEADVNREMGLGRGLMGSAAWGFMRSIPLEAPQLRTRVIDLPASYEDDIEFWAQSICKELSSEEEREIVYTRDRLTRSVPRLERHHLKPEANTCAPIDVT